MGEWKNHFRVLVAPCRICHRSVLHPPLQRVALPDAARCVFLDRIAHLFSWWVPRRRRADSVSFRSLVFESEKAPGQISSAFSFGLNTLSVWGPRFFPSFLSKRLNKFVRLEYSAAQHVDISPELCNFVCLMLLLAYGEAA